MLRVTTHYVSLINFPILLPTLIAINVNWIALVDKWVYPPSLLVSMAAKLQYEEFRGWA